MKKVTKFAHGRWNYFMCSHCLEIIKGSNYLIPTKRIFRVKYFLSLLILFTHDLEYFLSLFWFLNIYDFMQGQLSQKFHSAGQNNQIQEVNCNKFEYNNCYLDPRHFFIEQSIFHSPVNAVVFPFFKPCPFKPYPISGQANR